MVTQERINHLRDLYDFRKKESGEVSNNGGSGTSFHGAVNGLIELLDHIEDLERNKG